MLVFSRKRAPPGPTQVPCPVPLAALRTPPDHTWCRGTIYAGRRLRTDGGRDASLSQSPRERFALSGSSVLLLLPRCDSATARGEAVAPLSLIVRYSSPWRSRGAVPQPTPLPFVLGVLARGKARMHERVRAMDARPIDCPTKSISLLGVLSAGPADLERQELRSHLPGLSDDGDQVLLLDLEVPVDVVHGRPAVVVNDQLGDSVLLSQLHRELDREMLGDDVGGGRNLLGAFMPISLKTLADVEHSRASTSAGVAAPVADRGRLHPFSRLFCAMASSHRRTLHVRSAYHACSKIVPRRSTSKGDLAPGQRRERLALLTHERADLQTDDEVLAELSEALRRRLSLGAAPDLAGELPAPHHPYRGGTRR